MQEAKSIKLSVQKNVSLPKLSLPKYLSMFVKKNINAHQRHILLPIKQNSVAFHSVTCLQIVKWFYSKEITVLNPIFCTRPCINSPIHVLWQPNLVKICTRYHKQIQKKKLSSCMSYFSLQQKFFAEKSQKKSLFRMKLL